MNDSWMKYLPNAEGFDAGALDELMKADPGVWTLVEAIAVERGRFVVSAGFSVRGVDACPLYLAHFSSTRPALGFARSLAEARGIRLSVDFPDDETEFKEAGLLDRLPFEDAPTETMDGFESDSMDALGQDALALE